MQRPLFYFCKYFSDKLRLTMLVFQRVVRLVFAPAYSKNKNHFNE